MVGHEAVRNDGKPLFDCRSLNLRHDEIDSVDRGEAPLALERAEREEIPMETEVIEGTQMIRFGREHAERQANRVPFSRNGPAKAGHYVRIKFL